MSLLDRKVYRKVRLSLYSHCTATFTEKVRLDLQAMFAPVSVDDELMLNVLRCHLTY